MVARDVEEAPAGFRRPRNISPPRWRRLKKNNHSASARLAPALLLRLVLLSRLGRFRLGRRVGGLGLGRRLVARTGRRRVGVRNRDRRAGLIGDDHLHLALRVLGRDGGGGLSSLVALDLSRR